ncbi:hypothetical protein ANANG_G00219260 [Anguilla anguilla]|uniref:cAMP-dependent protein kinase inhibitor gamma n=1 Tax=Anguilla anguilla TaxID=7936 RepID=A0A9D3LXI3_ANGAN|nr:hypothetical protein ANANG_G00219260 [Anguilla anguilla]
MICCQENGQLLDRRFSEKQLSLKLVDIRNSCKPRCNERAGHGQMMDVETSYSEFITCDRTGRRNAVPDIKEEGAVVGTSELTKDMAQMNLETAEGEGSAASPPPEDDGSGSQEAEAGGGPSKPGEGLPPSVFSPHRTAAILDLALAGPSSTPHRYRGQP